jgi:large subunit ribosomal protein L20
MARVKRGTTTHARHKKVLDASKGFVGRSSTNYRIALQRLEKSLQYAYRDRRVKKREFRKLWIIRINAACRMRGMRYSEFINGLQRAQIMLDRKSLSEVAIHDPATFDKLVELAKKNLHPDLAKHHESKKKAA